MNSLRCLMFDVRCADRFLLLNFNKTGTLRCLLSLLLLLNCSLSFAQRLELPLQDQQVISIGAEGILILTKPNKTNISITKYDTDLQKSWTVNSNLEENSMFEGSSQDDRAIYLLFSKFRSNLYEIVKVNIGPGFIQKFSVETISRLDISNFKVSNQTAYIAGMVKDEPILLQLKLETSKTKLITGGFKSGTASIQSVEVDSVSNDVRVSYSIKKGKSSFLLVKRFDEEGKNISQILIQPDEDYGLLTGKLFHINENTQIMLGNYGYQGMSSNGVPLSQGLYLCKIQNDVPQKIKYYSFTDFVNFFDFMTEKQQAKIEKQIQKKKDKGSDLKLNYRLLVHDIVQKNNEYVLVAEAFYPEFRYNNNNMYGGFGSPYSSFMSPWQSFYNPYYYSRGFNSWAWNPWLWGGNSFRGNNQQIFDGFRYTHAVVVGFDTNGKLLWDNSIGFDGLKSMELKEKVHVNSTGEDLTLVYSNAGKLNTKTVNGNKNLTDVRSIVINSNREGDKVRNTGDDETEFWYDNYFLAWGVQKIANENDGRRNVFYINKIKN